MTALPEPAVSHTPALDPALQRIASAAATRDAAPTPTFPADAFALLRDAGALAFNVRHGRRRPVAAAELTLVRRVAAADGSVGRIFDGHLNAVERLITHAPAPLRDRELASVVDGRLLAGVWGGDPIGGEGPPAAIVDSPAGEVLRGVKTFCSGAGGLQRAAVLVRDAGTDRPVLTWIDLTDSESVEVDERWYRAAGLRASVSHRVVFHDAPVLARLGAPGAISEQPWFARDALRTAASWAGMADTAVRGALAELAGRPRITDLEALGTGRIQSAHGSIDAWLIRAADAIDAEAPDLPEVALFARHEIAECCRRLLSEAAAACGSRPFAHGSELDRARRDLELFLLQHRLDPLLARAGHQTLAALR